MLLRNKLGWPVEKTKGRWFQNILRILIKTNIKATWKRRKKKDDVHWLKVDGQEVITEEEL